MNESAHTSGLKSGSGPALSVAVVGARGYSGLELCRLLLRHPNAKLAAAFATSGFALSDYLPEQKAKAVPSQDMRELFARVHSRELQVVFLATPVAASIELAPKLLEFGIKVIDLSGAFRLQAVSSDEVLKTYRDWYQIEHANPSLVNSADYGLVPWCGTSTFQGELIANPGCFATAILVGLLPLLKNGLIDPASLVIDAKSGSTGAGRKAEERLLHAEVDGQCLPYRIGRHQHLPEIQRFVSHYAGVQIDPHFTTHLLNVRRGILAGIYANLKTKADAESVKNAFAQAYGADPLISVDQLTDANETSLLNFRRVVGSARTQITYRVSGSKLYVFSQIDNLMKGAASQAVENFNRLLGLPTWTGLIDAEGSL